METRINKPKLAIAVAYLFLTIGVLQSHNSASLFPELSIAMFMSVFVLLLTTIVSTPRKNDYLLIIFAFITLSIMYKLVIFKFPPGLSGMDPDQFGMMVSEVIQSGDIYGIPSPFYSDAPLYMIFISSISLILDLSITSSIGVNVLTLGIIPPLVVVALCRRLGISIQASIFGVAVVIVATRIVRHAYWPTPQSLAMCMFMAVILLIGYYYYSQLYIDIIPIVLLLTALTHTHKFPLVLILLTIIVSVTLVYIQIFLKSLNNKYSYANFRLIVRNLRAAVFGYSHILLLLFISTIITFLQIMYITNYIDWIIPKLIEVLSTDGLFLSSTGQQVSPTHSVTPHSTYEELIIRRGHGLILLPIGFIGLLYLKIKQGFNIILDVLLSAFLVCSIFVVIGVIDPDVVSSARALAFMEFVLAIGISGLLYYLLKYNSRISLLVILIISVVLLPQLFAAPALPDHNDATRFYLNEGELESKIFLNNYAEGDVGSDFFYVQERHPDEINQHTKFSVEYKPIGEYLIMGNITEAPTDYIIQRKSVNIYSIHEYGRNQLTWDPISSLNNHNNNIYNNGRVYLYDNK